MNEPIVFSEYQSLKLEDFPLKGEALKSFNQVCRSIFPKERIFDISIDEISSRFIVGTMNFRGYQIEILPKLLAPKTGITDNDTSQVLKNLMFMLSYTHNLKIKDFEVSKLGEESGSFLEVFISLFSAKLSKLISRSIPRSYIPIIETTSSIKGKILFSENLKHNPYNASKVICQYDEFSEDNRLMRLLKYVSEQLLKVSKNFTSRKNLNKVLNLLEHVSYESFDVSKVKSISLSRTNEDYIQVFELAKLFVSKMRSSFHGRDSNQIAILFNMNELFEEFTVELIRRNMNFFQIKKVEIQKGKRLVRGYRDIFSSAPLSNDTLFNTYTDIMLQFDPSIVSEQNSDSIIIDTKYKLLNDNGENHYNVKNNDVYQVLTYKLLHIKEGKIPHVALLYPQNGKPVDVEFRMNSEMKNSFFAITMNLKQNLSQDVQPLLNQLKERFMAILQT